MYLHSVPQEHLGADQAERIQEAAAERWDSFYGTNEDRFYKDRHYLGREWPQLLAPGPLTVLEVGCGAGNTVFPLLALNPRSFVYACDFSARAVALVRGHPAYSTSGRALAFVADLTRPGALLGAGAVPAAAADLCTMVFVLSAIGPAGVPPALANVAAALKPGTGRVLLRDYAEGDLAEARREGARRLQRVGPGCYVRGDGTTARYFTQEELREAFGHAGFECEELGICERTIENRARGLRMARRWVQGVFRLRSGESTARTAEPLSSLAGSGAGRRREDSCQSPSASLLDLAVQDDQSRQRDTSTAGCSSGGHLTSSSGQAKGAGAAGSAPEAMPEWAEQQNELDDEEGDCPSTRELLQDGDGCEGEWELVELPLLGVLRVWSVDRAHKHTLVQTGLMTWPAGPALARLLLACPALVEGQAVLELGCGASPLVALAALRGGAARVVASEGAPAALAAAEANFSANASRVVIERLRLRPLSWGDARQLARLGAEQPRGFGAVLGADIVYQAPMLPLLLRCAAALMQRSPQARVLLCHVTRGVSQEELLAAVERAGLEPCELKGWCRQQAAALIPSPLHLTVLRWQAGSPWSKPYS